MYGLCSPLNPGKINKSLFLKKHPMKAPGHGRPHVHGLGFSWVTVLAQPWMVHSGIYGNH